MTGRFSGERWKTPEPKAERGMEKAMYQRILLTLDGSELAEQAIEQALNFAKAGNGQIDVLCVVAPPTGHFSFGGEPPANQAYAPSLKEQVLETELVQAQDYVDRQVEALREAGVLATGISVPGQPAEAILNYADAQKVDLIVMATHGRTGLGRWANGSVADRVLHAAGVPVLLVRVAHPTKELEAHSWLPAGAS